MREIAFLEMPGLGVNRLWWPGGRYAYVSAHFDGFTDHILCVVDLNTITKPEIVARWWLPGMNRGAGEASTQAPGRRVALHHMLTAEFPTSASAGNPAKGGLQGAGNPAKAGLQGAGNPAKAGLYLGFGAWRDGGLTVHDLSDPATPRLL